MEGGEVVIEDDFIGAYVDLAPKKEVHLQTKDDLNDARQEEHPDRGLAMPVEVQAPPIALDQDVAGDRFEPPAMRPRFFGQRNEVERCGLRHAIRLGLQPD
ncbi:hypothetical protein IIC65_00635 [Candidatus Sumerlaeota bacterium]|nr:hypothetical protein [Candidatus Sumerlaeota bacterium]